jgi:hypothetical protein
MKAVMCSALLFTFVLLPWAVGTITLIAWYFDWLYGGIG